MLLKPLHSKWKWSWLNDPCSYSSKEMRKCQVISSNSVESEKRHSIGSHEHLIDILWHVPLSVFCHSHIFGFRNPLAINFISKGVKTFPTYWQLCVTDSAIQKPVMWILQFFSSKGECNANFTFLKVCRGFLGHRLIRMLTYCAK